MSFVVKHDAAKAALWCPKLCVRACIIARLFVDGDSHTYPFDVPKRRVELRYRSYQDRVLTGRRHGQKVCPGVSRWDLVVHPGCSRYVKFAQPSHKHTAAHPGFEPRKILIQSQAGLPIPPMSINTSALSPGYDPSLEGPKPSVLAITLGENSAHFNSGMCLPVFQVAPLRIERRTQVLQTSAFPLTPKSHRRFTMCECSALPTNAHLTALASPLTSLPLCCYTQRLAREGRAVKASE